MNNVKYLLFASLFLTFVSLSSCTSKETKKSKLPNIIFILADDMGYGDINALNSESKIKTPNLDKLVDDGMTFTDAHSGSAVCSPTRYGVLTGRYAWRTKLQKGVLWVWDDPLIKKDRLTIGKYLQQHGYSTAAIGKWHLGWDWPTTDNTKISDVVKYGAIANKERNEFAKKIDYSKEIKNGPVTRGFDYYFGVAVPNFPPYCFIENNRTVGIPTEPKPKNMYGVPGIMLPGWDLTQLMPTFTKKAVEYIKTNSDNNKFGKKKDAPFFIYLALTAPHTPIAPSKRFQGKSGIGPYGDFIMEVDWTVGQIVKALKESGQDKNTLIIFTSDNGCPRRDGKNMGGALNSILKTGHNPSYIFKGIKSDDWEGGHHVPFIAKWPAKIKPGTKCDDLICLTDFYATAAAIVGGKVPANAAEDSYNMLPAFLVGNMNNPIREVIIHHSIDGSFAVRRGKWKLILAQGSGGWSLSNKKAASENMPLIQLYDVENDIEETTNVYKDHPDVVTELVAVLEKYVKNGRSTPGKHQKNDVHPDIWKNFSKDQLEALIK